MKRLFLKTGGFRNVPLEKGMDLHFRASWRDPWVNLLPRSMWGQGVGISPQITRPLTQELLEEVRGQFGVMDGVEMGEEEDLMYARASRREGYLVGCLGMSVLDS